MGREREGEVQLDKVQRAPTDEREGCMYGKQAGIAKERATRELEGMYGLCSNIVS